ncbi:MAG: hypothetical protein GQ574_07280 [Crocinitomix sp.]|nr:hypothetical protein [Crocinitomix sp.]
MRDRKSFISLLGLFFATSLLIACQNTSEKEQAINQNDIVFEDYVEILKKNDSCSIYDPNSVSIYTKENTSLYPLGNIGDSKIVLIETEKGCGYTGSCGNRCLIIKDSTEILYQNCGFIDHVSDSIYNGINTFFDLSRGYQTGYLKYKVFWTGNEFDSKKISRNDIPWSVLTQLPLDKEECVASNYDCFDVGALKMEEIIIGEKGETGLMISAPHYIFENNMSIIEEEYWLFATENKEEYHLLNTFHNVSEVLLDEKSENGYYNILTEETDSNSFLYVQKVYKWDDKSYVETSSLTDQ